MADAENRLLTRSPCHRPARLQIEDLVVDGQIVDVCPVGCRFEPRSFHLVSLASRKIAPGSGLVLLFEDMAKTATLAWSTNDFSSLGCLFDDLVADSSSIATWDSAA